MEYKYDVALSFAGEDREYVKKVADILEKNGVKVFYDSFETVNLWGKDLGIHFDFVYRNSAKYCILFISKYYKDKLWTSYEIKSAISRAIESNEEYILPARFDDTDLPGLRPTLGFIDLRKYDLKEFAELILRKISDEPSKPITQTEQKNLASIYLALNALLSDKGFETGRSFSVYITNLNKEYRYFNEPVFVLSKPFNGTNAFYLRDKINQINFPIKLEYGEVTCVSYLIQPQSLHLWEQLERDTTVIVKVTTTIGESFDSNIIEVSKIIEVLKDD